MFVYREVVSLMRLHQGNAIVSPLTAIIKITLMKIALLGVSLLFTLVVFGQKKEFTDLLKRYHNEQQFNGVVLVATNGKIDYLAGIGVANRQTGTEMKPNTKFKIASVTKTFTAILILQLYEQGKIKLNVPFGAYFPTYKGEAKDKVTIEHLLTYSSGIPNDVEGLEMAPYQTPLSIDAFIDTYCSGKLAFTPGEKSYYSNTEYTILHKIIENVSGVSYAKLVQTNILSPLAMENTGLLYSKDIVSNLTNSYTLQDSTQQLTNDEPYFIENYFGSAAMYSTAEDLLKLNLGIFNRRLLNESTTQLFLQPNVTFNGATLGGIWYSEGYGEFNQPFIYRTGGLLGSCSNWIYSIPDQTTIITLNNTDGTNLYELSEQLYKLIKAQR